MTAEATLPAQPVTPPPPKLLGQHELYAWASRVEDGLAGSKAQLAELNRLLVQRTHEALQALSPATRHAILQGGPTSEVRAAYLMGQLVFAQTLVSQALVQRADDDFVDLVRSSTYGPLVQTLYLADQSNQVLAATLEESEEGVCRKLRVLREKGITDFRKNGRLVVNFLTPAARQVVTNDQQAGA